MCFKKISFQVAYENGLRRCPCCNIQLVWKSVGVKQQKNLATVDHIIPSSMGGADTPDNMFVMCHNCNVLRGTNCFVDFVSSRGVSKSLAETLFKKAHIATLQSMIMVQFTTVLEDRKLALKINRKRRKQIKDIIINYTTYFGDYLPEFQLLQRLNS